VSGTGQIVGRIRLAEGVIRRSWWIAPRHPLGVPFVMSGEAAAMSTSMRSMLSFVSIVFVAIVVGIAPAAAQQGDLNAIVKRYDEFFAARNYAAALAEAQKFEAVVKARYGVNHALYGPALRLRAKVYRTQGKYADAEGLSKRALAIIEKALGASHALVAPP
jgi:tetratricopeptide (TPR) repeat protein